LIPLVAFSNFRNSYEPPDPENEGFDEMKEINLIFDSQQDKEKERYWRMWLELGGSAEKRVLAPKRRKIEDPHNV
jgi:hypothetical protein